jgi:hypothetical protein
MRRTHAIVQALIGVAVATGGTVALAPSAFAITIAPNSPITANSANNCTGSPPAVPTCTA